MGEIILICVFGKLIVTRTYEEFFRKTDPTKCCRITRILVTLISEMSNDTTFENNFGLFKKT